VEKPNTELLQGTLDLLILQTLAPGPVHGWGISQRIRQVSALVFEVNQGSLYPALHRLEHRGSIRSLLGTAENNRRVKLYRLTAAGRKRLAIEKENWGRIAAAVGRILAAT